jgi:hypothetical protein
MIKLFIYVFFCTFLFSCKTDLNKPTACLMSDTLQLAVKSEIPQYTSSYLRSLPPALRNDSLLRSNDDLQIRFWFDYAFADQIDLLVIKYNGDKWTAERMNLFFDRDLIGDNHVLRSVSFKKIRPKSDWKTVLSSLCENKVMTLPHMDSLVRNKKATADGEYVTIEVKTKTRFRSYWYWSPESCSELKECKSMINILKVLSTEFPLKKSSNY